MHSSVISSETVISRENPIYLLNEQLEISPFTLANEVIDEFLVWGGRIIKKSNLCSSPLLVAVDVRKCAAAAGWRCFFWIRPSYIWVHVVVVAPQTDGPRWWWGTSDVWCRLNPKIGERSCVSPLLHRGNPRGCELPGRIWDESTITGLHWRKQLVLPDII